VEAKGGKKISREKGRGGGGEGAEGRGWGLVVTSSPLNSKEKNIQQWQDRTH